MGDAADLALDGTLCAQCGTYLGDPVGFSRLCGMCEARTRFDEAVDELVRGDTPVTYTVTGAIPRSESIEASSLHEAMAEFLRRHPDHMLLTIDAADKEVGFNVAGSCIECGKWLVISEHEQLRYYDSDEGPVCVDCMSQGYTP